MFELHREAAARVAKGRHCINATLGVLMDDAGSLAVLPTVAEVMRSMGPDDWAPYAGASGTDEFLEGVVAECLGDAPLLRENAVAVATPGATGAIRHALTTFLGRDHAWLTSSFHWGAYSVIALASQRRMETFQLFDPESRRFDIADFERQLARVIAEQRRALVLLNDPCHNPTGYTMTAGDWSEVAGVLGRYAAKAPIAVVIDSVYAAFSAEGTRHALHALEPLIDRLLLAIAWSASKAYTCYGHRVGALIAVRPDGAERKHIRSSLAGHSCGTWGNCNRGGLAAIARLLNDPQLRGAVQRDRQQAVALLNRRSATFMAAAAECGLQVLPYGGGFFTTVFVEDAQGVAAQLRAKGIYVVPMNGALRIALSAVRSSDAAQLAWELRDAIECGFTVRAEEGMSGP